jgi:hypothetical protein
MVERFTVYVLGLVSLTGCAAAPSAAPQESIDRGPSVIALDGDPNGLTIVGGALVIADDNGNRLLRFSDDAGVAVLADLPQATDRGPGLGQPAALPDGRVIVPRFGFGSAGDIVVVNTDGSAAVVTGLDPARRRIGATVAADGTMFIAGFVVVGDGQKLGSVWRLSIDEAGAGTEVEVIAGLQKPVGVLAVGDALFISDQERGEVLRAPLADLSATVVVSAGLASADLLSAGPDGSLFTGSKTGQVFQISASGEASVFADGLQEVRGTAYDAENRRLFVADHDGDESDGITHQLRVLPVGS